MIDLRIQEQGIDLALSVLNQVPTAFSIGMEAGMAFLRDLAVGGTPVLTGHAKASWGQVERVVGGLAFQNPVPYTEILELGIYKNVGPRTVRGFGGHVFSRQAPQGILTPLAESPGTLNQLAEIVAQATEEVLRP